MSENASEKTLAPTEKRLKDAAKNGDVLRSKDLGTAIGALAGAVFLQAAAPWLFKGLSQTLRTGLVWDRTAIDQFSPDQLLLQLVWLMLPPVLAIGGGIVLLTVGAQLALAGGHGRFMASNMVPKFSRLNPVSGFARMFGAQGWIEVAKGMLKVGLLGTIAWRWAKDRLDALMQLGAVGLAGQVDFAWQALTSLMLDMAIGLVIIALIDFPVQWLRRQRRLRMSLQEVKDEHKEQDGSPEAKAHRRQRQRQIAMGSIARAMMDAQFIITNPTHFAVAMTYDANLAPAPVVLAKGRGDKALAMRELAAERGLPVLEFPALARSVYYTTRERQMIREELYAAVAGILAFVFSLKRGETPQVPEIDVPIELRYDPDGRLDPGAKN